MYGLKPVPFQLTCYEIYLCLLIDKTPSEVEAAFRGERLQECGLCRALRLPDLPYSHIQRPQLKNVSPIHRLCGTALAGENLRRISEFRLVQEFPTGGEIGSGCGFMEG